MFANIRLIILSSILLLSGAFAHAGDTEPEVQAQVELALETLLNKENELLVLKGLDLDREALDYSIESLKVMDTWLQQVHLQNSAEAFPGKAGQSMVLGGRGKNTLMLAGLYMGETVRRNSDKEWYWVPFADFLDANPVFANAFGEEAELDTFILVTDKDNAVAMPINSALKRVISGPVDSVHYVGTFLAEPVDMVKAVEGYIPDMTEEIETGAAAAVEKAVREAVETAG